MHLGQPPRLWYLWQPCKIIQNPLYARKLKLGYFVISEDPDVMANNLAYENQVQVPKMWYEIEMKYITYVYKLIYRWMVGKLYLYHVCHIIIWL